MENNSVVSNDYAGLSAERVLEIINQFHGPKTGQETRAHGTAGRRTGAIYVRKSVMEKHSTHYSPENQERICREYAVREGIEVVACFMDLDQSSRNAKRGKFQEMLTALRRQGIDVLIVAYSDRAYRNGFSFPKLLEYLDRYGVQFASVTEQFDTRTFHGRLIAIVLGVMAEWPIWTASMRGKGAKHRRAEDGLTNASFRFGYCDGLCSRCTDPNGYGYCPFFGCSDRAIYAGKRLIMVPHPIEQHAVRLMAHLYHAGWSDKEIANHLSNNLFELPDGQTVQFRTKGVPACEEN